MCGKNILTRRAVTVWQQCSDNCVCHSTGCLHCASGSMHKPPPGVDTSELQDAAQAVHG